mmetsp:Transcript_29751/g.32397  ORF Transcript_29751/g.32397 Transcript_29751/m.32397 type:complete len:252 (+) Transcript_29751:135-890(+)|eukprot:gene9381-10187_t
MGACSSSRGYAMPAKSQKTNELFEKTRASENLPSPWDVMYQSHQALFHLLDQIASMTLTMKREQYSEIRGQCNTLFLLLKIHARAEDTIFFPAVEKKFPGIATKYGDDHKRSAEGRPKLLEALDRAADSDELFEVGMATMRKFCEANKAHQLGEEEVINPNLPSFPLEEQRQIIKDMAELDPDSWNSTYCCGIFARVNDEKRMKFLKGLQQSISAAQFAIIMQNIRQLIQDEPNKLVLPLLNSTPFLMENF